MYTIWNILNILQYAFPTLVSFSTYPPFFPSQTTCHIGFRCVREHNKTREHFGTTPPLAGGAREIDRAVKSNAAPLNRNIYLANLHLWYYRRVCDAFDAHASASRFGASSSSLSCLSVVSRSRVDTCLATFWARGCAILSAGPTALENENKNVISFCNWFEYVLSAHVFEWDSLKWVEEDEWTKSSYWFAWHMYIYIRHGDDPNCDISTAVKAPAAWLSSHRIRMIRLGLTAEPCACFAIWLMYIFIMYVVVMCLHFFMWVNSVCIARGGLSFICVIQGP